MSTETKQDGFDVDAVLVPAENEIVRWTELHASHYEFRNGMNFGFIRGARWQWQKDQARIQELEDLLREAESTGFYHWFQLTWEDWQKRARAALGE